MHTLAMHQTVAMTEQETHQAPGSPFTIAAAHRVMQFHVACRAIIRIRLQHGDSTRCPR